MNKSKLIKRTGSIFGTMLEYNLILTGAVVGGLIILSGNKRTGKTIQRIGKKLGRYAGKIFRLSSKLASIAIDMSSNEGLYLGRKVGKNFVKSRVRIYGDPNEFFPKNKIVEAEYELTK
jgi:hypothetical protein